MRKYKGMLPRNKRLYHYSLSIPEGIDQSLKSNDVPNLPQVNNMIFKALDCAESNYEHCVCACVCVEVDIFIHPTHYYLR